MVKASVWKHNQVALIISDVNLAGLIGRDTDL